MKPYIPILIVLMLISASFVGVSYNLEQTSTVSSDGNTLYVGGSGEGNYTKIQDAIDDAHEGDTVFVYDDSSPYIENIYLIKSLRLVGEDKKTTIIDGNQKDKTIISPYANKIEITGFTIQNSTKEGIYLSDFIKNFIHGNIIKNCKDGITFGCCHSNIISENIIENCRIGVIMFTWAIKNKITNNIIRNHSYRSIQIIGYTFLNTFSGNHVVHDLNDFAIETYYSFANVFKRNNIICPGESWWGPVFLVGSYLYRWKANYWSDWIGIGPFIILGARYPIIFIRFCPIINFDWHPAREPYDIPHILG